MVDRLLLNLHGVDDSPTAGRQSASFLSVESITDAVYVALLEDPRTRTRAAQHLNARQRFPAPSRPWLQSELYRRVEPAIERLREAAFG